AKYRRSAEKPSNAPSRAIASSGTTRTRSGSAKPPRVLKPIIGAGSMEVVKITPRGYCHGVVKATNIAREQGRSADGLIYALGQLVHNRHVLDDLAGHGVQLLDGQDRLEILE